MNSICTLPIDLLHEYHIIIFMHRYVHQRTNYLPSSIKTLNKINLFIIITQEKKNMTFILLLLVLKQENQKHWNSAYLHEGTFMNVAIRQIRIEIRDLDRHQNLNVCSMIHCQSSLKISCKSVRKILRKVTNRQTDRQANRQANNDDYITSLAEVIRAVHCAMRCLLL